MTTFTDILGAIGQDATQPTGATKWSDLDKVFAEQAAATEPGATPGSSAAEQEAMAGAAKAYEDSLLIPEPPTAVKALTLGLNLREVERGLRTQVAQAAQAVATPGLRAKFIESVVNPLLAVAYPYMKPVNDFVIPEMAKAASMAMEPADSGLTTADLPTELLAARGAAQGMAAGQAEGIMADISRAVGQSIPQTAAVGATILTGGGAAPVVLSNLASQALIPFSAWTAGQLSYMDELDAVRAQEALEGRPLTQFDPDEMQRRGIASGAIQTGTEAIGAGIAGRAIGRIAARATALRPAKAVVGALAERGAPIVGRALATRGGQAAGQAFARATSGAMRFNKGFLGQASKIVALSAAEEGAEELGAAILEAPFTFAPLGDDLKQGLYGAFIGGVAGGAGGAGTVAATVGRKALVNRADAFRPENDAEVALRQQHTEAMKARTNWTADLDDTQRAEVAVALNSMNGMDPAQRGEFLKELADQRSDIAAKVESLLALRQDLDAAIAGLQGAQATYEAGAPERAAKESLVSEAQAALDKATADYEAARELVAESELQAEGTRSAVLREERQADAETARAEVDAARKRLDAAKSEVAVAQGLEIAPGMSVDPAQSAEELRSMIEETDAELGLLVTDRLLADAKYGAVRDKLSDMPMDFRQQEPAQVLSSLSGSSGTTLAQATAPRRGGKVQKELEALGMRVVWFKATGRKFGSPAFHSMESRGTIYLNVDSDMSQVRARALEEMFHDIQMFRPDVAQAYSEAVGVGSAYAAGERYARGQAESQAKGVMDTFARIQAAAAEAGVAEELPATVQRIGAARLEQEGQANAFVAAAQRVSGRGLLSPLVRAAARQGLMGREVAGAMAVIDTVARAAAVERVSGVKPVSTLSPLARTLLWAEDMAVDIPSEIQQATEPAPAPAAQPSAPGISMAREQKQAGPIEAAKALVEEAGREAIKDEQRFFKQVWPTLLGQTRRQLKLSSQNFRLAARRAISDLETFLRDNPKFADYYNKDWAATRAILSDYLNRPITDDEFVLFRIFSGLNSPNTKLPSNQRDAVNMTLWWINNGNFDAFKLGPKQKTGTLIVTESPLKISGTTANIKLRSMKAIEQLIRTHGSVVAASAHLQQMVTTKELNAFKKEMGYKGIVANIGNIKSLVQQATGQDVLIPRMFIFGQKVGAYTLNAIGDGRFTTVDIWESRHIRSYFEGMFEKNTGLPVTTSEHDVFTRFNEVFREEFEKATGQTWQPSALQAVRWFYIIDAAKRAGYTAASTNETISFYTERTLRTQYGYGGTAPTGGRQGAAPSGRRGAAGQGPAISAGATEGVRAAPGISMARATDADYMAAVERGDMEAAQRMVDEAAKAAGIMFRGHKLGRPLGITETFVSQSREQAQQFANQHADGVVSLVRFARPIRVYEQPIPWQEYQDSWRNSVLLKGYDAVRIIEPNGQDISLAIRNPSVIEFESANPITRDEAGNIIPLSRRFDVSRPEISFARPQEDAETTALREEVSALRAQADELRRQMRDVQNVTAAQRVNAMKEVRVLERRIVTAERLAEQKTLQATRAKMRLDLERQAAQEDIRAAEDVAAKMAVRLDEVQASVRSMRSELASLRRGERVEERLAQAEEESQRAIDFAYAIGRNEGLLAGEVRGQQVERRQVRKLSERLDVVQARLDKAIPALRESRAKIKDDAKAAQRAIDFAYGMGLAKGRLQGVMEGRRQVLARMARREDTLQNQLFNLRKTAEARAEAKESVQDAVRQIALDAARMLPERLRGPLATRIAQAKTLAQANRVAVEAVKVAANNEVAQSIDAIRTLRKRIGKRGMTYATRTAVERLLDDAESGLRTATGRRIRATVQTARGSAPALVNAVEVYAAVVDAAAKVEQAVLMYDMDRQRYLALRAQRIARYDALRQSLAQNMSGRPTLSDRERADQPPGLPLARAVSRANSDIYTLMLELEGTEMGVIGEMLMEAQAGKGEAALEHATILRGLQPALQAAGYESIDAYALRNGLLGQSSAQVRDVTLGGRTVSLPVGTIISIAAMDDETLALFPDATNDGQSITFRGAETTTLIRPSKAEISALRSGLSAGERGLIDAMKNVLETQIRDRVMDAVFAVEGDQPPVVANYWPRVRLSKQKADASILNASAGTLVRGALTNVGFANARTGGTEPLVYDDAFKTWERHVQVALDMIHMAQPYRTAATVLTDPAVVEGMDRQMGQGTAERVLAIFSNGVGATARSNLTVIDKFTNNVTGAILAMRPKTLAKVLIGGQIRLASELPVGLLARGSARAARRLANPRAWDARVEEIHSLNGYFARRHQLHMRSIVSGSLSDADRVRVTTAFSAMIDGFRAAGQSIAAAQLTDALAGFRDASNGANMMIASVVDALRYMDEQIMLTAVEARLIEVEDEGIRTGQDALREAALRAERDFRRTQNASDEFDDVSFAAHARVKGQTGLRIFFPFSSDPLKARNQIRRAYLSGDRRLQTAGAIAGNAASSTIIGLASIATVGYIASLVSGILGGTGPEDEEEKKFMEQAKRLPASVSAEVLSSTLGYAGIIMGQVVQGMQYRRPLFAPLVGRPIEQAGRELTSADPWYARMVTSLLAISQYAGFPMYGLYQFVREQFEGAPAAKEKAKPEPKTPAERLRDRIERRRRELQNIGK